MQTQSAPSEDTPDTSIDELFSSAAVEPLARSGLRLNAQILSYGGFAVVDTADSIQNVSEQIKAFVEPLLVRA